MGCTKRLCEQMILAYQGDMMCWAVRFGNVVGSRGSVVPLFEKQIQQGGPVTITHPEMTRYMMTIREAVALVISTLMMARAGHVYMLDMGEPVRIVSLVEAYAAQAGFENVDIKFTGLRPGEKLNETLFSSTELRTPTAHPRISATCGVEAESDLKTQLEKLYEATERNDPDDVRLLLTTLVPEYTPPDVPVHALSGLFDTLYPDDF